jgi:hypothetical protein
VWVAVNQTATSSIVIVNFKVNCGEIADKHTTQFTASFVGAVNHLRTFNDPNFEAQSHNKADMAGKIG